MKHPLVLLILLSIFLFCISMWLNSRLSLLGAMLVWTWLMCEVVLHGADEEKA